MQITFTTTTQSAQVSLALARLIGRHPEKTVDQIISDLILDADDPSVESPSKVDLLHDVNVVTAFMLNYIAASKSYYVDEYVDACFKRGLLTTDYFATPSLMRRLVNWIIDELDIRTNNQVSKIPHVRNGFIAIHHKYKPAA